MEANAALAFVFDLDGVLVDTSKAHERAYADVWRAARVPGVPYECIAGRPTPDVLKDVLAGASEQDRQNLVELKRSRARLYLETTDTQVPGADELLHALRALGTPLGLVTGACRSSALRLLERESLAQHFHVVVTADDVPHGKPHPAGFCRALREMRVAPEHALVVEDSHSGIRSALSAGAWVASVHSGQSASHARFCGSFPTLRALHGWLLERRLLHRQAERRSAALPRMSDRLGRAASASPPGATREPRRARER